MESYKNYTIQYEDECRKRIMFFKTSEGIFHDYAEDTGYCGNCRWADSIEEAKEQIDELIDIENGK